jgi:hypothetical protein
MIDNYPHFDAIESLTSTRFLAVLPLVNMGIII